MPLGVNVEVDGGYARISFPDQSKVGPALHALLATGAPIEIRTGGPRRVYIVPEGNAREAGLLDAPRVAPVDTFIPVTPAGDEPAVVPPKKTAGRKAPSTSKETSDGQSKTGK